VDAERAGVLRDLLAGSDWARRTREFAAALRGSGHAAGGLLLVGTPTQEPWHLTAHLAHESRLAGIPELEPVLVRHRVPAGAPAHLAVDLARLERARRGETVFVVAPDDAGEGLLQRVHDARRSGATVLSLDAGDRELRALAHEALTVGTADSAGSTSWRPEPGILRPDGLVVPHDAALAFEAAQHLVSLAAGEVPAGAAGARRFRDRLARIIDAVSGPAPAPRR
jgi:hypothetical protein